MKRAKQVERTAEQPDEMRELTFEDLDVVAGGKGAFQGLLHRPTHSKGEDRDMNSEIRELSPELTVEEMTDDQLDVVCGGISIPYQQVKFEYKEQKAD
jgi:hypothetical protein